jgi:glucan phosphoethanolaminetransferase (alkaline phosphatase superfamily)
VDVNVVISILSSVAVTLPGYTVSLGLAELAANRIVRGAGHVISGLVTLLWLVLGGYLGKSLVMAIARIEPSEYIPNTVNQLWLILFIPLIAAALNVAFYFAHSDFFPAFFVLVLSYVVSFNVLAWLLMLTHSELARRV